jgi:hypothetical protein
MPRYEWAGAAAFVAVLGLAVADLLVGVLLITHHFSFLDE